ncbi:Protein of unknown function DUF3468 [Penicillium bovifimosum]|uniref:Uncharacterized protein n=1 Tax=Penicillium bovifimosum TaxID=126998 RepID=A0A9W9HH15_9EURO|nr:Protein of unknown function DUF3468 [Penicillium bovifimosum]KAJ5146503.1 Protein of unknown function DUF3468 [Penicillium bovifimosum]
MFDELLWGPATPDMFVLAWELSGLHTNLVVVVAPGTKNAWILRVVLTPEFLWFRLHWAGWPYPGKYQLSVSKQQRMLTISQSSFPTTPSTLSNSSTPTTWLRQWPSIITWGSATGGGELNHHLGIYLSPAAAAKPVTVPPMEDLMPMEGIEVSVGVLVATVGTSVREYYPGMDVCEESGGDLHVLADEYLAGTLLKWDQLHLFDELLWGAATPEMFVMAWELSGLHTNLVVVVAPGTENAWILLSTVGIEATAHANHLPAQLTDYSTHLLQLLHSHHLVASMALHYNMGVSNWWWELNHHLGLYLSPAAAAKQATVPAMEDIMPMEGIEASAGVSVPTVGNSVREYSPDMDICEERGVSSVAPAPAPAAAAPAPPTVHTSVR